MKPLLAAAAVGTAASIVWSCTGPTPAGPTAARPTMRTGTGQTASASDTDPDAPRGLFTFHPNPTEGPVPLGVRVNMCKSTDPQPDDSLRFTVNWGDGERDRGSCRLEHTYESPGTFRLRACVSDRVPGHEVCEERVVEARSTEPGPGLTTFAVLPLGDFVLQSFTPPDIFSVFFLGNARLASQAEANSALKVVVTLVITENTISTGLRCGVSSDTGQHVAGAPDIAGRTGTASFELTPGQFGPDIDTLTCFLDSTGLVRVQSGSVAFLR